jgi:thiamine-phosphate pyrophosphorylase
MATRCLLYYITDRSQFSGNERARRQALVAKVGEATRCGIDYIQLREKDLNTRELEMLAREAVAALRNSALPNFGINQIGSRILINSRTDIALAAEADGVHLRADDITPIEVRQVQKLSACLSHPNQHFLVTASCHSIKDVKRAESDGVDFAVFAPVFEKNNSPGARLTGLAALREACRAKVPVLALGGVTTENAGLCVEAGAAGVAGIRLFQDNKIEDVVRALRTL